MYRLPTQMLDLSPIKDLVSCVKELIVEVKKLQQEVAILNDTLQEMVQDEEDLLFRTLTKEKTKKRVKSTP